MEDLRRPFGERVRDVRLALGLSQEELAERAEMHWTYVSGIERGLRNPGLNTLGRLATALGLTLPELLAGVADSRPRRRGRTQGI